MKRAVLVGAGHAHLYTLKRASEFARHGFEIVLIAPEPFWYSGLATGMLGGFYDPALDQIDVGKLIAPGGGRWLKDSVVAIYASENRVELASGGTFSYDVLSLNAGSVGVPLPGSHEQIVEIKPLSNLARLRREIEQRSGEMCIVVAGAGPSGCEIAANLRALLSRAGRRGEVILLASGPEPLAQKTKGMREKMSSILRTQGVQLRTQALVKWVTGNQLRLSDGSDLSFDFAVNATGLKPPSFLRQSGLPVDEDGALIVNRFLQSPGSAQVFGGGDCIAMEGRPLDKVGVYAIREAPVLHHNLLASLRGEPLQRFQPQKNYLQILNLGDGSGLATWGRWHWHSRLAFRWKDYLDRKFLAEYRNR